MPVSQSYSFADLFALTRATKGWSFNASGALTEAASGALRVDYDPATLAWRGWPVESQAVNQVNGGTEGASMPNTPPTGWAIAANSSGMTREITAIGVEAGIPYIDLRWSGTAASTFNRDINLCGNTVVAAASGETWWAQVPLRVVGGNTTNVAVSMVLFGRNSGGTITEQSAVTVTGSLGADALRKYTATHSRLMTVGTTAFVQPIVRFGFTNGLAADITLRVGAPQLWKAQHSFSPSLAASGAPGASTRDADDLSMIDVTRWMDAAQGTVVIDFTPGQAAAGGVRGIVSLDDGTADNRIDLYMAAASPAVSLLAVSGGVTTVAGLSVGTAAPLTRTTLRMSWGPAGWFASLDGAVPLETSGAAPVTLSRVRLGNRGGTAMDYLNGWIGPRFEYFREQYTDTPGADGFTIRNR